MITLTQTQIDQLLTLIRRRYPNWQSVHDSSFVADEIDYKQQAVDLMRTQLGRHVYEGLLRNGHYEEIANRLIKVAQATNLLYMSTPQSGDLRILYDESVDQGKLCHRLFQLLYGDAAIEIRLQGYIDYLQQYDPRLNYWTFPTYYLFLAHPDREIFIKPRLTQQYLAWFGLEGKWSHKLSVDTYVTVVTLAQQLQQAFQRYGASNFVDVQSILWAAFRTRSEPIVSPAKRQEFIRLFHEFVNTYPQTPEGQFHIANYQENRTIAQRNVAAILAERQAGHEVTERILLQLLPYANNSRNRESGAWIHLAPTINGDLQKWYEAKGWTAPHDWPHVAQAILDFVLRCAHDPEELSAACAEFTNLPYSKGFQAGMLTPILNALAPDEFALVNGKPVTVLNYLTESTTKTTLIDYPVVNEQLHHLHHELADILATANLGLRPDDTFDMFCHWLVAVKKYPFRDVVVDGPDGLATATALTAPFSEVFAAMDEIAPIDLSEPHPDCPFSRRTFDLLALIHATPTSECYMANKSDFVHYVEEPFKRVLLAVGRRLPPAVREVMETEKRIFARFTKNDWGQGGAWPFYWGAFYPKGSKRSKDAQLSMLITQTYLEFGFYIGEYSSEQRMRFQRNCEQNVGPLSQIMTSLFNEGEILLSADDEFQVQSDGMIIDRGHRTWHDFIRNPIAANCDASLIIPAPELLALSFEQLVQRVVHGHQRLFPLVLAALEEQPMPLIGSYLEPLLDDSDEEEEETSASPVNTPEPYTQAMFLQETSLAPQQMADLLALLQDKQQLILQGPPGTGKTYVAQRLAKLLTGLSDPGRQVVTVQFHPAYGYEDFIEGIRPESKIGANGHNVVDYPVLPGRFQAFCTEAARYTATHTPFVFIIDEINRGNIPRIFGELMYLLEYREERVLLPYSGHSFQIPSNVYLIGTMNTADRSIALVDFALRRRFYFVTMRADPDLFKRWFSARELDLPYLPTLYRRLCEEAIADPHYHIGPSYFIDSTLTEEKLARIWRYNIEPLLLEYYVENPNKAEQWFWDGELVTAIRTGHGRG